MASTFILLLMLASPQDEILREAARLDSEQKCPEAEAFYQKALARGAPSQALLNNLGNHYLACGNPSEARKYFERLLQSNPLHVNSNLQLARMETQQKHGTKALEYLARVKATGPDISLLRAEALLYAGKRAAALQILDTIEKEAGSDQRLQYAVGLTCARAGLYDRAEKTFTALLAVHPDDFDLLYNLGRAAARAQHYDRAQRALDVAVKLRPEDIDAGLELGLVYAAQQDYEHALYILAQARQAGPERSDIALALARTAEDGGYYGDSALAYDDYLRLKPADDIARRDRARVCGYTATRAAEGLKELRWYVQKYPNDAIGHYDLAQLIWSADSRKALEELTEAVRLDAKFVPARYARAWLLNRLGRTVESVPDLRAAVAVDPRNVRALDQLGLTYLALERPAEAEPVLRRALALAPQDPEVLMHLGRALMAVDRPEEAQQFLEKFEKVRANRVRDPRKEAGMIELATLPQPERMRRSIARLTRDAHDHPSDPELQLSLARLLLSAGRAAEAKAAFQELLTRSADNRLWNQAGKALLDAGQYSMAKKFLERGDAPMDLAIATLLASGPNEALQVLEKVPQEQRGGDFLLLKARILDTGGRSAEADEALQEGLRLSASRPEIAQAGAVLLVKHKRVEDAMDLIARALTANPDNADLTLTRAVLLGLRPDLSAADRELKRIESHWPEWDRPYLVHAMILIHTEPGEARKKLQTSAALGSRCARAELGQSADAGCPCAKALEEFVAPGCE
ncbi:MAG: tetratricopeptide repeat protein [Bryobacteraceae bacterium]